MKVVSRDAIQNPCYALAYQEQTEGPAAITSELLILGVTAKELILWGFMISSDISDLIYLTKCLTYLTWPDHIHPRNLTWNLKVMFSKRTFLFPGLIFGFHVKFRGCIWPYWYLSLRTKVAELLSKCWAAESDECDDDFGSDLLGLEAVPVTIQGTHTGSGRYQ